LGFMSYQDKVVRINKLMQAIGLVLSHEELVGECNLRNALNAVFENLEIKDDILKTPEEKQADMQNQMEMDAMAQQKALEAMKAQEQVKAEARMAEGASNAQHDLEKVGAELQADITMEGVELQADMALADKKTENDILKQAAVAGLGAAFPQGHRGA